MKAYKVQFSLPVDNPVNNIRMTRKKTVIEFEVPINTPDLANLGYSFLAANAVETVAPTEAPEEVVPVIHKHNKKRLVKEGE